MPFIRTASTQITSSIKTGFRAINIEPGSYSLPMMVDDRRLYPIYAQCEDVGVPVIIMAGGSAGPEVVERLDAAMQKILARPDMQKQMLAAAGLTPAMKNSEELARFWREEFAFWAPIVKRSGVSL